jgi:hypothetical protein
LLAHLLNSSFSFPAKLLLSLPIRHGRHRGIDAFAFELPASGGDGFGVGPHPLPPPRSPPDSMIEVLDCDALPENVPVMIDGQMLDSE